MRDAEEALGAGSGREPRMAACGKREPQLMEFVLRYMHNQPERIYLVGPDGTPRSPPAPGRSYDGVMSATKSPPAASQKTPMACQPTITGLPVGCVREASAAAHWSAEDPGHSVIGLT